MKLNSLTLKDKKIFRKFLSLSQHKLSVYAFANIYIWKGLFSIRWAIIEDSLCVFFQDKWGRFLYLPPLAKQLSPEVIKEAFKIMDSFNANKEISRIENAEEKDLAYYRSLGYAVKWKSSDYLCRRKDLAQLKGNAFKSKRASRNYFLKHNIFEYLPFSLKQDRAPCLKLYQYWEEMRRKKAKSNFYQGMLRDSFSALSVLLNNYRDLNCVGRIVKIGTEVKAFTFGFKLNRDTFCILYEITDLLIKGAAQFIFAEFCRELTDYRYINMMDDSGLENLKKVKLSYRPVKLIPAYIIKRSCT